MSWATLIAGALGLTIAWGTIPLIIKLAPCLASLRRDHDFHHTNKTPIPRFGGLALAAALIGLELYLLFAWGADGSTPTRSRGLIILSSLAMFAIGFLDDVHPIGAKKKLFGQIAIALTVWLGGIGVETFRLPVTGTIIPLGLWGGFFTILWLVGITNLVNLIDGVDGLAGGICLMLMALTAYTAQATPDLALLAAGMAGALIGFLRFNFPPARIYLGDGGAYFLGFQIGIYSLVSSQKGTILAALAAPLFVLALPIADTAIAILRRGLRGLPIFRADRRHIHHHLLGMGWSRRQVVLWIYSITALFMGLGIIAFWSNGKLVPVLLGVVVLTLLIVAGQLSFSREWFAVGRVVGNSLEMRQEIQYALLLCRWLALEGSRCRTLDELWEDLAFTARKLGFSSAKLSLGPHERKSTLRTLDGNSRVLHFDFQAANAGSIELAFPGQAMDGSVNGTTPGEDTSASVTNLHEILGELVAEGWLKAINRWHAQGHHQNAEASRVAKAPVRPLHEPLPPLVPSSKSEME